MMRLLLRLTLNQHTNCDLMGTPFGVCLIRYNETFLTTVPMCRGDILRLGYTMSTFAEMFDLEAAAASRVEIALILADVEPCDKNYDGVDEAIRTYLSVSTSTREIAEKILLGTD